MWALMAFVFGTVDGRNDISPKEGKSVLLPHATLAPLVEPLFDGFLCASIGDDRNGTGLIVPCALARLNVGPWQQDTSLARMPREAAAARLSTLTWSRPATTDYNKPL
jgi:hypothetical protein